MSKWIPFVGWKTLTGDEAAAMEFDQPYRWHWRVFEISWLGYGVALLAEGTA